MDKRDMLECLINYYTDGNKAKFAAKIGITPQLLSKWMERKKIDAEFIYSKCEGVRAEWLLTGEGEMLSFDNKQNDNTNAVESMAVDGARSAGGCVSSSASGNGSGASINGDVSVTTGCPEAERALYRQIIETKDSQLADKDYIIQLLRAERDARNLTKE